MMHSLTIRKARRIKRTPWNRLRRASLGAPLWGLRPGMNGTPFVPAQGQGLRPCAACKDASGAPGGGQ